MKSLLSGEIELADSRHAGLPGRITHLVLNRAKAPYHFLHECALIHFRDRFYTAWNACGKAESDRETVIRWTSWDEMFRIIPAENFGLEIDPAHMVWQGIDYIKAVYDFAPRIFHAHAKDTEIRPEILARCGIYGLLFDKREEFGHGWWRGRAPGWGSVDWKRFITALLDIGYKGNLDIEHEDDVFAKAANLNASIGEESDIINNYSTEESGLLLGYNTLSVLIPKEA